MRDTSLAAYWSERLSGRISHQQSMILENLAVYGGATRAELSKSTNLPINCICGRVNELLKLGYVVDDTVVRDEVTGKHVHVVRLWGDSLGDTL